MKNPNAFIALLAGAAVTGLQWALRRYAHLDLPTYWATTATAAGISFVLWIGRQGVKGALQRLWNGAGSFWGGSATALRPLPAASSTLQDTSTTTRDFVGLGLASTTTNAAPASDAPPAEPPAPSEP